jgi:hypothetical protein
MPYSAVASRRDRRAVPGSAVFDRSNPIVYIGTIDGARKHRARPGSLVAPLDIDPELFIWPVADAAGVLLVSDPDTKELATRVASCMLRDGARMVAIVGAERSALIRRNAPDPGARHELLAQVVSA